MPRPGGHARGCDGDSRPTGDDTQPALGLGWGYRVRVTERRWGRWAMTRGACWAGIVAVLVTAAGEDKGQADGFIRLFDGKSLDGWAPVSTDRFLVRDGVIVNDGGTGWLRSARPYKDF